MPKSSCAYCGAVAAQGKDFRDHVRVCQKHPLKKVVKIVADLISNGPCPFKNDVSREYADAYSRALAFVHSMGG